MDRSASPRKSLAPSTPSTPVRRRVLAVLTVAVVGFSLGIAGFTFNYAEGLSYLSDDPKACVNCHVMQEHYDGWLHGFHSKNATCNDCHVPHDSVLHKYAVKAEHGYRHSKGFTLNNFHEPIQITKGSRDVVIDNCMRCHDSIAADLSIHARDSIASSSSSDSVSSADCLHCHSRVGHGPTR